MQSAERWAIVDQNPAYEVSTLGRVRRRERRGNRAAGSMLARNGNGKGYLLVSIWSQAESRTRATLVHRLVALAFLVPPSSAETEVDHIDGEPSNCRLDNLEWVTPEENRRRARARDLTRLGSCRRLGAGHRSAKFNAESVLEIRAEHAAGSSVRAIAKVRGCTQVAIWKIVNRRTWAHVAPA